MVKQLRNEGVVALRFQFDAPVGKVNRPAREFRGAGRVCDTGAKSAPCTSPEK